MAVGATEVICAVGLLFCTPVSIILACVMGGAVYTHHALHEDITFPAAVLGALLVVILLRSTASSSTSTSKSSKAAAGGKSPKRVKKLD